MKIKDQLSKVRVLQTELSMLLTRFREFHKVQASHYFYLPEACRRLEQAAKWLGREAERLQGK